MFRRLFWFAGGVAASLWVTRRVRSTVERYRPERLSADVATSVRGALAEGRRAMREREAELRARFGDGPPALAPAPPASRGELPVPAARPVPGPRHSP